MSEITIYWAFINTVAVNVVNVVDSFGSIFYINNKNLTYQNELYNHTCVRYLYKFEKGEENLSTSNLNIVPLSSLVQHVLAPKLQEQLWHGTKIYFQCVFTYTHTVIIKVNKIKLFFKNYYKINFYKLLNF